jgi:hypothetical protein
MDKWRQELVVNGKCDALDTVNKWYTATIMKVEGEMVTVRHCSNSERSSEVRGWL